LSDAGSTLLDCILNGNNLEIELMVVKKIHEAEKSFNKLRKGHHALWEHTDKLEAILRAHEIPFQEFWGW